MAKMRLPKLASKLKVENFFIVSTFKRLNCSYDVVKDGHYIAWIRVSPICVHDFTDGVETCVPYDMSIETLEGNNKDLPIELFKKAFLATAKIE